jgi:hypothetical protein
MKLVGMFAAVVYELAGNIYIAYMAGLSIFELNNRECVE